MRGSLLARRSAERGLCDSCALVVVTGFSSFTTTGFSVTAALVSATATGAACTTGASTTAAAVFNAMISLFA